MVAVVQAILMVVITEGVRVNMAAGMVGATKAGTGITNRRRVRVHMVMCCRQGRCRSNIGIRG
jgi:hypothetical protein